MNIFPKYQMHNYFGKSLRSKIRILITANFFSGMKEVGVIWLIQSNPSNHLCPQYLDYSAILVQLRNNYDISTVKNAQTLKAFH